MGVADCMKGCLGDVMTCEWWDSLPWYTKTALGACGSMCATCGMELAKPPTCNTCPPRLKLKPYSTPVPGPGGIH